MISKYLLFVGLSVFCVSGYAGVAVETVTRDLATNKEDPTQHMQIQDGMARIESGTRGNVMIFKDETMFMLDTTHKTYMAMDRAALEKTMTAMNDMMQKMQAKLANMPPEQRAMMENMMKQNGMGGAASQVKPAVYDAVQTNESGSAAGRNCKQWTITRDGAPNSRVCVVPYAALPGKDEVQALAKKMSALFEKLPESFRGQYTGNPFQQGSGAAAKLNGVPFITRGYREGVLDSRQTAIKSWQQKNIAASQFEIPAGYVKKELPMNTQKRD